MSIEIKKEDPLEENSGFGDDFQNEFDSNEDDSMDFEEYSCSNPAETSSKPTKSRERLSNPTTIDMPSIDEIMMIKDLNWKIALQRHKTTQELTNDSRTKVAKLLIKHIYERKFQVDGNYDLKWVKFINQYKRRDFNPKSFQDDHRKLSVFNRHACLNFSNGSSRNLLLSISKREKCNRKTL